MSSDLPQYLLYFNPLFACMFAGFVAVRLSSATTFDERVHATNLVTEALLVVLFLTAFLADMLAIPLQPLFSTVFSLSLFAAIYVVLKL